MSEITLALAIGICAVIILFAALALAHPSMRAGILGSIGLYLRNVFRSFSGLPPLNTTTTSVTTSIAFYSSSSTTTAVKKTTATTTKITTVTTKISTTTGYTCGSDNGCDSGTCAAGKQCQSFPDGECASGKGYDCEQVTTFLTYTIRGNTSITTHTTSQSTTASTTVSTSTIHYTCGGCDSGSCPSGEACEGVTNSSCLFRSGYQCVIS